MINEILTCDECQKQSEDICGEVGWIRIESSGCINFVVSNGRNNKQNHQTKIYKKMGERIDFCCKECMLTWMGLDSEKEPHAVEYMLLTTLKRTKDGDVFDVVAKKE
jgi:hypothetical protein